MEEEYNEDDFKYCPPQKEGLSPLMRSLAPQLGRDFLLFDTNGSEYVQSGIVDPISTGIPCFVSLVWFPHPIAIA